MKKSTTAYVLVALMLATAAVYFVAAAEESTEMEGGEESEQALVNRNDFDDESREVSDANAEGSDMATQVQTAFFAVVGVGYTATAAWVLRDKGRTNLPYLIAIGGSIAIIGLYVASRSIDLPVVGLQDDVGAIDILSKVLQVAIIGVAASIVNGRKELQVALEDRPRRAGK